MARRVSATAGGKLKWLAGLLALVLLAGVAWPGERFLVPQEMPLPLYARGLGYTNLTDGWVVTSFFYPVDTIPRSYDLSNQPVYKYPVGTVTPYVEGALIFGDSTTTPEQLELHNVPGARVPMWLTPVANWTRWTINAMEKAGPLVGWADSYHQTAQPIDPAEPTEPWHVQTVASGFLEDGRSFRVTSSLTDTLYSCTVTFGE